MSTYKPFEEFLKEQEEQLISKPGRVYLDSELRNLSESAKEEVIQAKMKERQRLCDKENAWKINEMRNMYSVFAKAEFPTEHMAVLTQGNHREIFQTPFYMLTKALNPHRGKSPLDNCSSIAVLSQYFCGKHSREVFRKAEREQIPTLFFYDGKSASRFCVGRCAEYEEARKLEKEGKITLKGLWY